GPNRAAAFTTIGAAAGIDKGTMETLSKVYSAAADMLGRYIKMGGALVTGAGIAVAGVAELVKAFGLIPQGKSDIEKLYDQIKADL
ncbi:hypothetical protein NL460_28940, partial [Klebsiella pneumoniae]|nr:hypothetical protein [Klebsiella pneumoniae]